MSKDSNGRFAKGGRGGPGRGKRKELADKYRRETIEETAQALVADMASLDVSLAVTDSKLAAREVEYLESIKPLLRERAAVEVTLSRCRVSAEYLQNPFAFNGFGRTPGGDAQQEFQRIQDELSEAGKDLAANPGPVGVSRMEALADHDLWTDLCSFERCRDRVTELRAADVRARQVLEMHGLGVPFEENGSLRLEDSGGRVRTNFRREALQF